jgi:hypothetical protein
MQFHFLKWLFFTGVVLTVLPVTAQKKDELEKQFPTLNLSYQGRVRGKDIPKEKNIRFIIKNDTKGILYGNPCMNEETRRMNFEYVVQNPGLPGSLGNRKRLWNNFVTKLRLTITRTPFWKLILKARVKDCRQKSGDLVG